MVAPDLQSLYRARQLAMRQRIAEQAGAAFAAGIDYEALDDSFAGLVDEVTPIIALGQEQAELLTLAYLTLVLSRAAGRTVRIRTLDSTAGNAIDGRPLAEALDAIPAMMKGQVLKGMATAEEVLAYGRFLTERLASAETIRASDEAEGQVVQRADAVVEWDGIVDADACDPCREANEGRHAADEEFYRHANCGCTREWVVVE